MNKYVKGNSIYQDCKRMLIVSSVLLQKLLRKSATNNAKS